MSFSKRVAAFMAGLHAQNVAGSFKFLGAVILRSCLPTFKWTVWWTSSRPFQNVKPQESVETAKKTTTKVSIAFNVAPSGATIALLLITLSERIKTTVCLRLRIFKIMTLKTWKRRRFRGGTRAEDINRFCRLDRKVRLPECWMIPGEWQWMNKTKLQ